MRGLSLLGIGVKGTAWEELDHLDTDLLHELDWLLNIGAGGAWEAVLDPQAVGVFPWDEVFT